MCSCSMLLFDDAEAEDDADADADAEADADPDAVVILDGERLALVVCNENRINSFLICL